MSEEERPEMKKSLRRRKSTPERAFRGKAHLLKRDNEGVASTVGTIMALLVFITFLALLTNSYVPAWMQDNERSHMSEVFNQFGELKGKIDSLIVGAQITGESSVNLYQPINLGSEGVPVFASPTAGLLTYIPQGSDDTKIQVSFDNGTSQIDKEGGGRIEFYAANRYYVQQYIVYENGAILVKQDDGQVVRAFPSLDLNKINGAINIKFTQINMQGSAINQAGTTPSGINLDLLYIESNEYDIDGGTWTLRVTSLYGSAWEKYLNDTCAQAGLTSSEYSVTKSPGTATGSSVITLTISQANTLTYNQAFLKVTLA